MLKYLKRNKKEKNNLLRVHRSFLFSLKCSVCLLFTYSKQFDGVFCPMRGPTFFDVIVLSEKNIRFVGMTNSQRTKANSILLLFLIQVFVQSRYNCIFSCERLLVPRPRPQISTATMTNSISFSVVALFACDSVTVCDGDVHTHILFVHEENWKFCFENERMFSVWWSRFFFDNSCASHTYRLILLISSIQL